MAECVAINGDMDVVLARKVVREVASSAGFNTVETVEIATAVSELARNILLYAKSGTIEVSRIDRGLEIVASDKGPGIPDIELAMRDGYTTSRGLGLGLPGARRLSDEFYITSEVGKGTTVRLVKRRR